MTSPRKLTVLSAFRVVVVAPVEWMIEANEPPATLNMVDTCWMVQPSWGTTTISKDIDMPGVPFERLLPTTNDPVQDADPYHAIVRAEVAMEIINGARTLVEDRLYAIEESPHPDEQKAARLNAMGARLYALLRTIDYRKPAQVEDVIRRWGALLRDEPQFWKVMQDEHARLAS